MASVRSSLTLLLALLAVSACTSATGTAGSALQEEEPLPRRDLGFRVEEAYWLRPHSTAGSGRRARKIPARKTQHHQSYQKGAWHARRPTARITGVCLYYKPILIQFLGSIICNTY